MPWDFPWRDGGAGGGAVRNEGRATRTTTAHQPQFVQLVAKRVIPATYTQQS